MSILEWNGIPISTIAEINGIPIGNIAEWNGIALPSSASLSISPPAISFDYIGTICSTGTITVTASTGNSWTASPDDAWIFVSGGSGTGSGSFTVSVSKGSSFRIGYISVTSDAPTETISVSQDSICF